MQYVHDCCVGLAVICNLVGMLFAIRQKLVVKEVCENEINYLYEK